MKARRTHFQILIVMLKLSLTSILANNNYIYLSYANNTSSTPHYSITSNSHLNKETTFTSSETTTMLVRYKDATGRWKTGKFSYEESKSK